MFSFNQLPVEIWYGIFYHIDIPDILRMRRVSRYLNQVSHNKPEVVWNDAFRKAKFVRPPGPFLSQSAHDLENAVVSGFRVDRNLRHGGGIAQEERPTIKLKEIRYTGVEVRTCLIFGRFLFIASSNAIRCYDLNLDVFDSRSSASIIYRSTSGTLRSCYCVSTIDVEGRPFTCVVLNEETGKKIQISIYSFNLGGQFNMTLDLLHQFEHDVFTIDAGSGSDDAERRLVALDVHTRTQFLLSSFTHVPFETDNILFTEVTAFERISSISTSTHLIIARLSWTQGVGWSSSFEAFALPPPDPHRRFTPTLTPLDLSHRGTIPRLDTSQTVLLNGSILDPITQDILVVIRVYSPKPSRPFSSKHGVLRLSGAPTSDNEVGTITFQLLGPLGHSRVPFPPPFNGTSRMFYTRKSGPYVIVSALEYDLHAGRGDEEAEEASRRVPFYPAVFHTMHALGL